MAWFYLLINAAVIMTCAWLRYESDKLCFASPVTMGRWVWIVAIVGLWAGVALAAGFGWRRLLGHRARRAMMELMILTLFFVYEWLWLHPRRWMVVDWLIVTLLVSCIGVCFWRDRDNWRSWGIAFRQFLSAGRLLIVPTLLMIIVPVVVSRWVGTDYEHKRLIASLMGYPFYALVQLMIFQVFLVPRLRHLTDSAWVVVLVSGGVFGLLHWPNGLLMASCCIGAMVWTAVYLRRADVYALALSMGLAATALGCALPRNLTHNLRTGPRYVTQAHIYRQGANEGDASGKR